MMKGIDLVVLSIRYAILTISIGNFPIARWGGEFRTKCGSQLEEPTDTSSSSTLKYKETYQSKLR